MQANKVYTRIPFLITLKRTYILIGGVEMNNTERFIAEFYQSIDIVDYTNLSIECVAEKLNIKIVYWEYSSTIAYRDDRHILFIDWSLKEQQKWQEFGHEMSHYFNDETNYSVLEKSYAVYGETKADYFAYHFCVPTFMLLQIKGVDVYKIMNLFNVEYDFALRRLEMYQSKLIAKGEAKWQKVT